MSILEALPNVLGHSVPTILVIGAMVLLIVPFFREMSPSQTRSARIYGFIIGLIGIGLSLVITPSQPEQQPIPFYIIPTPVNVPPTVNIPTSIVFLN